MKASRISGVPHDATAVNTSKVKNKNPYKLLLLLFITLDLRVLRNRNIPQRFQFQLFPLVS